MAEHPSFTLAGLRKLSSLSRIEVLLSRFAVAVGGTAGYMRTRSTPSLVAGLVLGASYGYAGMSIASDPIPAHLLIG
jgi:hypothetical protein